MKKSISIFGCGWLGLPLAQELVKKGYSVKGSTTSENKLVLLKDSNIEPHLLTLESIPNGSVPFFESEVLIVNIPSKNVLGFKKLVELASKSPIKQVLFISSTSVYDPQINPVTETSPTNASPLVTIEEEFQSCNAFHTSIIRFSGLIGYNRKPGNWFSGGRKIPNPEGHVNMIHRDDCIQIIIDIINKALWGDTFNGCADTHPSRREFYTVAKQVLDLPPPVFEESVENKSKTISNQKLHDVLGYEFIYPDVLKLDEMP